MLRCVTLVAKYLMIPSYEIFGYNPTYTAIPR